MPIDPLSPEPFEGIEPSAERTLTVNPSSPPGSLFAPTIDSNANGAVNAPLPPAPAGYELIGEIGRGSMGVVYQARQIGLNRLVALKVILAGGHASTSQRSRFLHEAEAVAAINHAGIVGVYEFGTWEGQPYMALEYCDGGTLAEKLRGTPLPPREATILIERVARAVAIAHEKGIVHRDIKPANVLIAADGTPKVGDFGVAKIADTQEGLTATYAIMGTPSYMAPEQARGEAKNVGPAADVYALGAVLYECLTGKPPFKGANSAETILQTLNQEPVSIRALNPLVPVDLETVCLKCLEKEPIKRYPSAQAFADDLRRFLEGLPVIARPVGSLGRMRRWVRRNQVVTALLAVIVLAVLTGTTATYIKYRDEAAQRDVAEREANAKERALRELQLTLAVLEKLTAEQKQTLVRLSEEKAASEDAFLRGLLRPLREHSNFQVTLEEAKVLFELAGLPEERLRFRFVSRGLESTSGAATLAAWPQEMVNAVVGLDREAAARLRAVIVKVIRDEKSSSNARVASVLLASALPSDDKEFTRLVARALVDRMVAEKDSLVLSQLSDGLASFSPRLNPEDSMSIAKLLLEALISQKDALNQQHASGISNLASQLSPTDALTIARTIVNHASLEMDPFDLAILVSPLLTLAPRLNSSEAEKIISPLAGNLLNRMIAETNPTSRYILSTTLSSHLIHHLAPNESPKLAKSLLGRILKEKDNNVLNQLNPIFEILVGKLSSQDAALLSREMIEGMIAIKDPNIVNVIGSGLSLSILLRKLETTELSNVTSFLTRLVLERLPGEKDLNALGTINLLLMKFSEWLRLEEAISLEKALLDRMIAEKNANWLSIFATCIQNLAPRLRSSDAQALAEKLAKRMLDEKDQAAVDPFAKVLTGLLSRLGPTRAAEVAGALIRSLAARIATETDPDVMSTLPNNVANLSFALGKAEGVAVARILVSRIIVEKDQTILSPLCTTIMGISFFLSQDDAVPLARDLVDRLIKEKDELSLSLLANAVSAIGGRLRKEDSEPLVRNLLARFVSEKDANLATYICNALVGWVVSLGQEETATMARLLNTRLLAEKDGGAISGCSTLVSSLAPRLTPTEATMLARTLMGRIASEKDQNTMTWFGNALSAVAARLNPEDAAPIAQALAARMVSEKDPTSVNFLGGYLSASLSRLSDADLFAIMKSNLVFSPILNPALNEFGRRSARTHNTAAGAVAGASAVYGVPSPAFKDTWEFVEWAEKKHPEFNFRR